MPAKNFTATLLVDKSPEEVFNAINKVRGWWSSKLTGKSKELHDEFVYRHKAMHYSRQKLVEVVRNKKVVWLVTDSSLNFVKKKNEWDNTKISFKISKKGKKTQIVFTHHGLVPKMECYNACNEGWSYYIFESLVPLINTGKGNPD